MYNLRMKDRDSVTRHLNALNTVVSQFSYFDIKISDEDKCINLFFSRACGRPYSVGDIRHLVVKEYGEQWKDRDQEI